MRRLLRADVLAGAMFLGLAAWGFWSSGDLESGSAAAMGPGYFPRLLSTILAALGALILTTGLVSANGATVAGWGLRPIILVSLSGLAFAALLTRGGIVLAVAATVAVGAFAGGRPEPVPLALLTLALILAALVLFVWGIGIPLPVWPTLRGS